LLRDDAGVARTMNRGQKTCVYIDWPHNSPKDGNNGGWPTITVDKDILFTLAKCSKMLALNKLDVGRKTAVCVDDLLGCLEE
jgi:hypothetical protein